MVFSASIWYSIIVAINIDIAFRVLSCDVIIITLNTDWVIAFTGCNGIGRGGDYILVITISRIDCIIVFIDCNTIIAFACIDIIVSAVYFDYIISGAGADIGIIITIYIYRIGSGASGYGLDWLKH